MEERKSPDDDSVVIMFQYDAVQNKTMVDGGNTETVETATRIPKQTPDDEENMDSSPNIDIKSLYQVIEENRDVIIKNPDSIKSKQKSKKKQDLKLNLKKLQEGDDSYGTNARNNSQRDSTHMRNSEKSFRKSEKSFRKSEKSSKTLSERNKTKSEKNEKTQSEINKSEKSAKLSEKSGEKSVKIS